MQEIVNGANGLIWGWLLIYLLLGVGLWFTLRTRFIQVRHFVHTFGVMGRSFRREHGGVSAFEAYCTALAARVGTGNLAGVAVAIELGGPGAVFWMWLVALLGMATSCVESTLAQVFKEDNGAGAYRGGPAYYMERGLGRRWMGVLFSVFLILAYGLVFNAVQANSMADALHEAMGVDRLLTGIVVAAFTGLIIFGGIRRIARVAEIVVPFMAVAYLVVAVWVVATRWEQLPAVLGLVLRSAFGLEEAAAGGVGYAVSQAVMNGVKRGLFSNEAGMGSAPNAAATADVRHPASQGYVQMLGVFTDTMVICTCTAAIILLSGEFQPGGALSGVPLTQAALASEVGPWGTDFIAVALMFFAFTSIMANYYYGETSVMFIGHDVRAMNVYRLVVLLVVVLGAIGEVPLVWALADLSMGFMTLVNLAALLMLSGVAMGVLADYNRQLGRGQEPVFDPRRFPELGSRLAPGVWESPDGPGAG